MSRCPQPPARYGRRCRGPGVAPPAGAGRGRSFSHLEPPRRAGRGSGSLGEAEIAAAAAAACPGSTGGEPGQRRPREEAAAAGGHRGKYGGEGARGLLPVALCSLAPRGTRTPPVRGRGAVRGSPGGAGRLCWAGAGEGCGGPAGRAAGPGVSPG